MRDGATFSALVVRAAGIRCAIPLESVAETMRALPCTALASAPDYVRGACVLRGVPTAIVDLAALLGGAMAPSPARYVLLRTPVDPVAIAVDEVDGIRQLSSETAERMPRLLRELGARHMSALSALDADLLPILDGVVRLSAEVHDEVRATRSSA